MYKIEVDKSKKLVSIYTLGNLTPSAAENLFNEVHNSLEQFEYKEPFILGISCIKVYTPEILPIFHKLQALCADYGKKFAVVHEYSITHVQSQQYARRHKPIDNIVCFKTPEEAINYLYGVA